MDDKKRYLPECRSFPGLGVELTEDGRAKRDPEREYRYVYYATHVCPIMGHEWVPLTAYDGWIAFELYGPGRWVCRKCLGYGVPPWRAKDFGVSEVVTDEPPELERLTPRRTKLQSGN